MFLWGVVARQALLYLRSPNSCFNCFSIAVFLLTEISVIFLRELLCRFPFFDRVQDVIVFLQLDGSKQTSLASYSRLVATISLCRFFLASKTWFMLAFIFGYKYSSVAASFYLMCDRYVIFKSCATNFSQPYPRYKPSLIL